MKPGWHLTGGEQWGEEPGLFSKLISILKSPIPSPIAVMAKLGWHWHRLRAMGAIEVAAHLRKRAYQLIDARWRRNWAAVPLEASFLFPKLPDRAKAPAVLVEALKRDAADILAGHWKAFGHLELKVDDPPLWQADYLALRNFATRKPAFKLNHRRLPGGADIKLIWELSRWHPLARLAQAAWLLGDDQAGRKCVSWLANWEARNQPFRGWNWTSALESGLRLIQFVWIDAGLAEPAKAGGYTEELERLRPRLLPPHVWFTWRYRSFGSSANNHLLGELAGLIVALTRWPALARWGAPLSTLHRLWEKQVLAQFALDGGNREQALHYHLFSWELCWQARLALRAAGRPVSPVVEERLGRAAEFFRDVQVEADPWDYGDSDNAFVTPFYADERSAVEEWRRWFKAPESSPAVQFWWKPPASDQEKLGPEPARLTLANPFCVEAHGWRIYSQSGLAMHRDADWTLRWDLSPLGYLTTAAHGHCDALHLSIWRQGVALVIDPGTGAYYAEPELRAYLASWAAHNGPALSGIESPKRLGPFLWSKHHEKPSWKAEPKNAVTGELVLPGCTIQRTVIQLPDGLGWQVADVCEPLKGSKGPEFSVRWQFAPGSRLEVLAERRFRLSRNGVSMLIEVDENWSKVEPHVAEETPPVLPSESETRPAEEPSPASPSPEWSCSPAFRKTCRGPGLLLTAQVTPQSWPGEEVRANRSAGVQPARMAATEWSAQVGHLRSSAKTEALPAQRHNPCVFRTRFLASPPS
ncbi:MAG: heparinase II/III family protein [Verrucomicrobiota bacterium]